MPDILIQFHALPEELLPVLNGSLEESGVHIIAVSHFPFRTQAITLHELQKALLDNSISDLVFTLQEPVLSANSLGELTDKNPGLLRVRIGRHTQKGLQESSLTSRASSSQLLHMWRQVAKRLKNETKAGAVAINRETGASAFYRNHRFTEGALRADEAGVPILPVAGGAVYKLGMTLEQCENEKNRP